VLYSCTKSKVEEIKDSTPYPCCLHVSLFHPSPLGINRSGAVFMNMVHGAEVTELGSSVVTVHCVVPLRLPEPKTQHIFYLYSYYFEIPLLPSCSVKSSLVPNLADRQTDMFYSFIKTGGHDSSPQVPCPDA